MLGRRFIAVGETCVDAERTRRFASLGLLAARQQQGKGSRSMARPLRMVVSRGTEATHGGIGLGNVHRREVGHVEVDVAFGGASFGPLWLVHQNARGGSSRIQSAEDKEVQHRLMKPIHSVATCYD